LASDADQNNNTTDNELDHDDDYCNSKSQITATGAGTRALLSNSNNLSAHLGSGSLA
tara:strand:+ start:298 stop:468 length:171 start_codon:yes stop_codon:yes gene_type:complete